MNFRVMLVLGFLWTAGGWAEKPREWHTFNRIGENLKSLQILVFDERIEIFVDSTLYTADEQATRAYHSAETLESLEVVRAIVKKEKVSRPETGQFQFRIDLGTKLLQVDNIVGDAGRVRLQTATKANPRWKPLGEWAAPDRGEWSNRQYLRIYQARAATPEITRNLPTLVYGTLVPQLMKAGAGHGLQALLPVTFERNATVLRILPHYLALEVYWSKPQAQAIFNSPSGGIYKNSLKQTWDGSSGGCLVKPFNSILKPGFGYDTIGDAINWQEHPVAVLSSRVAPRQLRNYSPDQLYNYLSQIRIRHQALGISGHLTLIGDGYIIEFVAFTDAKSAMNAALKNYDPLGTLPASVARLGGTELSFESLEKVDTRSPKGQGLNIQFNCTDVIREPKN